MIPAVRHENARALATALGIMEVETAAKLLDVSVLVTANADDPMAIFLADEVIALLSRTIDHVARAGIQSPTIEIVIGNAEPRSTCLHLVQTVVTDEAVVIGSQIDQRGRITKVSPILVRLAACYTCAATMKRVAPELWFPLPDPLQVSFTNLGLDLKSLQGDINIDKAYLAGAGAIGNALLWAMQGLRIQGELHVVDFDKVEPGNLQRQVWFEQDDLGRNKAYCLVEKAQPLFPDLKLVPRDSELQNLPEKCAGPWMAKLIVAVDSRRVRRRLQEAVLPGEVFDASTTDITEVVLHYHRQPTEHACLSCVYVEDDEEQAFEAHIAEQLGIPVAKVRESLIDHEAAIAIMGKYPQEISSLEAITGLAYDSLFKSLCGSGKLSRPQEAATVAPFAFVSALAGILLGLELVRRHTQGDHYQKFNYWKVSPWQPPFPRNRRQLPSDQRCPLCNNALAKDVLRELWTDEISA